MIIQVAADAPLVVKAAAATVLWTHIGGAALSLVSGTVAIAAKKGDRLHRLAGNVFTLAMLAMGLAAAISGPLLPDRGTAMMGLFVAYLAATGWMAARRPPGTAGRFEAAALAVAVALVAGYVWLAGVGAASPRGLIDGQQPFALAMVAGALCAWAAVADARVLRAGLDGSRRLARHLWRMSLALAIAWGSFAGQPRAQPEIVRGSGWLFLPALAVLAAMVFWLIRVKGRSLRLPAFVIPRSAEG